MIRSLRASRVPLRSRFGSVIRFLTLIVIFPAHAADEATIVIETAGLSLVVGSELRIARVPVQPDPFAPPGTPTREIERACRFPLIVVRQIAEMRRLPAGQAVRHGKLTGFDAAGRKLTEEDYQDGTLHGASRRWFSDGRVAEEGSNAKGQKQGIWTSYIPTEQFAPLRIDYGQQILGWEAGLPHGVWEWRSPADKPLAQFKFARGRLVSKLPAGADVRLGELAAVGKLDPDTLFAVLKPLARQEFVETPLEDVANGLAEAAEVELYFDAKPDVLQSTEDYEIAADTPLLVALGQLLVPHKLACDHRYGMLWIAPAEEIAKWKDTTGISAIVPPAGSKLAEVWETPVSAQFVETPLVDGLQYLAKQTKHRLTLGDTRNIPSWTVTLNLHNHPLKHVLAIMLNQARFRCRLDGEKLFVEEQPFE